MKPSEHSVHALLIGIDHYVPTEDVPPEDVPPEDRSGAYYPSLRGCVRDVERVERWLLERGAAVENIEKLLAPLPADGASRPLPTYENMVAAFQRLGRRTCPGDHVWIHYSGHGGRVPTQVRDVKSTNDDEALVPTNIVDPTARYLRDVELALLLEELAEAGLVITVVLDCCHSGGAFRKAGPPPVRQRRGTGTIDATRRPTVSLVASPEKIRQTWRAVRKRFRRSLELASSWRFEPQSYVLLAACRAHEQAFEQAFKDRHDGVHPGGVLTHWLLDALTRLPLHVTYREVYDRVQARMAEHCPGQTPQLEGKGSFLVLETGTSVVGSRKGTSEALPSSVPVLEIDRTSGKILLNAGLAQAIRPGMQFAVYPPGSRTLDDPTAAVAVAEVAECGASSSWALVSAAPGATSHHSRSIDGIEPGAPAVVMRGRGHRDSQARRPSCSSAPVARPSRHRRQVRTVRLKAESSVTPEVLEELRRAVWDDGVLEALPLDAPAGEPADFEVVGRRWGYEIRDATGRPLAGVGELPYGKRSVERFVSWSLVHLARFHDVLDLTVDPESSPLRGALELELHRLPERPERDRRPTDLRPLADPPDLRAGDWVCLRLRNASYQVLNVALLDLQISNWSIEHIFPEHADFRPFEPEEEELLPFQLVATGNAPREQEMIKAFGTVDPTSFRCLRLPPIHQPERGVYRSLEFTQGDWTVRDLSIEVSCNGR